MRERSIVIALRAAKDVEQVWDYYATDASPDIADRITGDITRAFRKLAKTPGIEHRRADVSQPDYRAWRVHSYLIIYRSTETQLLIVRVVHARRDIRRLLD